MKSRSILLTLPLLALGVVAGTSYLLNVDSKSVGSPRAVRFENAPRDENSKGRRQWELMRLRDPATGRIPAGIRERELALARSIAHSGQMLKGSSATSLSWQQRGPINIGGRTRALAVDISNRDVILAGGVSGGMWRSANRGLSWTRATTASQLPSVTCIAQDRREGKSNIWYCGSGEYISNSADGGGFEASYSGDGISRSTDGGVSWTPLPSTSSGTPHRIDSLFDYVWSIAVDASNSEEDELYAACAGGIARSSDGGLSWRVVLGGVDGPKFSDVVVTSTGVVYAVLGNYFGTEGDQRGIWRSIDGVEWTRITPDTWPTNYYRIGIGHAPSNPNVVYFLAETPGAGFEAVGSDEWHSFFRYDYNSGDGSGAGGSWENRSSNLPAFGGAYGDYISQGSYDLFVRVRPDNENVVFIGGSNLYRSNDGFSSDAATAWIGGYREGGFGTDYDYPNHHPDQHIVVFDPAEPSVMYTGSDGGVHRTVDNMASTVSWTPLNTGYFTSQFYTVAIDEVTPGSEIVVGGLQDNGTWRTISPDGNQPWQELLSADGGFCAIDGARSTYYASTQGGTTFRGVVDLVGNILSFTRVDPLGGSNYLFINPFELDGSDKNIMYMAGGDRLWRNNDLASIPPSFDPASVGWSELSGTVMFGDYISAIATSTASPSHRTYYGTGGGKLYRLDDAHTGNPVRVDISSNAFPSSGYVSCIAVDPNNGNKAMALFSSYNVQSLFATTDAGASWTAVGGNLEQNPDGTGDGPSCRWGAILHRPDGVIYFIGTSTGLYSTRELNGMGTVWEQEGANVIGNVVVDMIRVRQSDGFVAVATHGGGVYSTYVGNLGVGSDEVTSGGGLILQQNVPNPVLGSSTIDFSLSSSSSSVQLKLYDARGVEVATLFDGRLGAGDHSVVFDRRKFGYLSAGSYFYRLHAGTSVLTRRMVVVE